MRFLTFALPFLLIVGCTDGFSNFPVTPETQAELGDGVTIVPLTAANVDTFTASAVLRSRPTLPGTANWKYRVGPGDILSVLVFNHSELMSRTLFDGV